MQMQAERQINRDTETAREREGEKVQGEMY